MVTNENNEEKVSVAAILHKDILEIKTVLRELTQAVTRLAVVEERQTQTTTALERAFALLDGIEKRLAQLELSNPTTKRISRVIDLMMLGAVTIVIIFILKHVGLQ